ncbi:hypothetical protein AB0C47_17335 [Micromonospora taraxaci]|uniref:hypothetical protein n=1 Tax=Micromonospora taraxaci TaxID=1316803 RepID=UPI0034044B2D
MWDVKLHPEVEEWFLDLSRTDPASADLVSEALTSSPNTGRRSGVLWSTGSRAVLFTT